MNILDLITHGLCLLFGIWLGWSINAGGTRFWRQMAWDLLISKEKGQDENH